MRNDDERDPGAVHYQLELRRELRRVARTTYLGSFLECRNLGQVERIANEDAVPGQIDGREVVDREVAERMRPRRAGADERRDDGRRREEGQEQKPPHETALRATGAKRTEKCGLSARAFLYHVLIPAASPAQPAA